ncbi:HMG box domain containing protein [Asbolus verrucosus]|uniref:HMG box domain containing protein n=1 Tax=Asbolus verrucosus TaxID=1661398 RepID=A0A482VH38_ASBVE|nr:HMG box domain containing protein [Asbolus verrucosus]
MPGQGLFWRAANLVHNCSLLRNFRVLQINQVSGIRQKVSEKLKELKVPDKPKRPLTAYFRFVQDQRPAIVKSHPDWKVTEISKQCASDWKMIDPAIKEQYERNYKAELEEYAKKYLEYSEKLTCEQKDALKEYNKEAREAKARRRYRKKVREHNKPKRPIGAYMLYILEQSKLQNKKYVQLLSDLKGTWAEMSKEEKSKYIEAAAQAKKQYDEELRVWELKMIKNGNVDLVRYKTLLNYTVVDKPKTESGHASLPPSPSARSAEGIVNIKESQDRVEQADISPSDGKKT